MLAEGRPRHQVSLGRFVLRANVYGVVACLCILPAFRLWEMGLGDGPSVVLLELVVVPLAWVLTSYAMIRDRALRAVAVTALLLSTVAALLIWAIWASGPLVARVWRVGLGSVGPIDWPTAALAGIGVPLLALGFAALARHLIQRIRNDPCLSPMERS